MLNMSAYESMDIGSVLTITGKYFSSDRKGGACSSLLTGIILAHFGLAEYAKSTLASISVDANIMLCCLLMKDKEMGASLDFLVSNARGNFRDRFDAGRLIKDNISETEIIAFTSKSMLDSTPGSLFSLLVKNAGETLDVGYVAKALVTYIRASGHYDDNRTLPSIIKKCESGVLLKAIIDELYSRVADPRIMTLLTNFSKSSSFAECSAISLAKISGK